MFIITLCYPNLKNPDRFLSVGCFCHPKRCHPGKISGEWEHILYMQGRKECNFFFFSEWGRSPGKHQVFVVVVVFCVCMSEDACIKYLLALSPVLTEKQFYVKQHCIHRSLHEGGLAKRELAAEERACVWHVLIDCLR